jgi:hypothetical protein
VGSPSYLPGQGTLYRLWLTMEHGGQEYRRAIEPQRVSSFLANLVGLKAYEMPDRFLSRVVKEEGPKFQKDVEEGRAELEEKPVYPEDNMSNLRKVFRAIAFGK